jgi:hypothetical protein
MLTLIMKSSLLMLQPSQMSSQEEWLVGEWAAAGSSCKSDGALSFETDGTYNYLEGEGVWALDGARLAVSSTSGDDFGSSEVLQIKTRGSLEMELESSDGMRVKYRRCSQED